MLMGEPCGGREVGVCFGWKTVLKNGSLIYIQQCVMWARVTGAMYYIELSWVDAD